MAIAERSAQQAWLLRVLGVSPAATEGQTPQEADPLTAWNAARDKAVGTLNRLLASIGKSEHPLRDRATIIVRAVRANLTQQPDTPQKVAELQKYIADDAVVAAVETPNVFNVEVAIRRPLLAVLQNMSPHGNV